LVSKFSDKIEGKLLNGGKLRIEIDSRKFFNRSLTLPEPDKIWDRCSSYKEKGKETWKCVKRAKGKETERTRSRAKERWARLEERVKEEGKGIRQFWNRDA
jgi:hypothetical protein